MANASCSLQGKIIHWSSYVAKQSLTSFFSYWAVWETLSTVAPTHPENLHNALMPFVLATDFKNYCPNCLDAKWTSAKCASRPCADVTPCSAFLILCKIKPDVNFLPWQRVSGAQLEKSSAPLPLSLPPPSPEFAVVTAQIIPLERVAPFGYLETS